MIRRRTSIAVLGALASACVVALSRGDRDEPTVESVSHVHLRQPVSAVPVATRGRAAEFVTDTPRVLRTASGDRLAFAHDPVAVQLNGRTLLFGFPLLVIRRDTVVAAGSGVELLDDGVASVIPLANPTQPMTTLRVAVGRVPGTAGGAVVHAIWSVRREESTRMADDTIMAATWNGDRWSAPDRVWTGRGLRWSDLSVSNLVATDAAVRVVAPASDSTTGFGGLRMFQRDARGWRVVDMPQVGAIVSVRAMPAGDTDLSFAILGAFRVASDPDLPYAHRVDRNGVYTARWSADSGLHALDRRYRGVERPAFEVAAVTTGRASAVVVWSTAPDTQPAATSSLHMTRTVDGGRRWSEPNTLAVLDGFASRLSVMEARVGGTVDVGFIRDLDQSHWGDFPLRLARSPETRPCTPLSAQEASADARHAVVVRLADHGPATRYDRPVFALGALERVDTSDGVVTVWPEGSAGQGGIVPYTCWVRQRSEPR